jgi:hypothetical protein
MLGVLYAVFLIQSVLYTFLLTETLATFGGISVLGGIVWPRANRWGALASLGGALATNFVLYWFTDQRLDYWDPNVFLAALVVGIAALVVVSLATQPEPAASIEPFFERLHTSTDAVAAGSSRNPDLVASGFSRTSDIVVSGFSGTDVVSGFSRTSPLLLVNVRHPLRNAGNRGWRAYRDDLGGFALGWAAVIALVIATSLFLRYG